MRYDYIDPFVSSTIRVLDTVIQSDICRGEAVLLQVDQIAEDVTIIVKLDGEAEGSIILNMPSATALKISGFMFGNDFDTLTSVAMDSIAELANMIAGNAASVLNDRGGDVSVFPPLILRKEDFTSRVPKIEAFQIPLYTEFGELTMNVALRTH